MKKLFLVLMLIFILAVCTYVLTSNGVSATENKDFPDKSEPIEESKKTVESFTGCLTAANAVLVDVGNDSLLFEKNAREKCFPASTTKVLTALIAIENCDLTEEVTVRDEANLPSIESSKAGIRYGEKLSMEQLLNCLLIPSGNDAAYTIAAYTARKACGNKMLSDGEAVQYFCELMNRRAKELGAQNSRFVNPDGFHSADHYSTAYDMCLIAQEAIKHKEFRDIVRRETYRLPDVKIADKNGKKRSEARILINTNKLVLKNDSYYFKYAVGVKTGHTQEAGYCLVSSAGANGKSVLAVVMNSTEEDIWDDSTRLLKWGVKWYNNP